MDGQKRKPTRKEHHMDSYKFDPAKAYATIDHDWKQWAKSVGANGYVVGISGGKDSTVVAALAARICGKENVLGVLMPNREQDDIADSEEICRYLGIRSVVVNIGDAYEELMDEVVYGALKPCVVEKASADTVTNMPARLRMTTLYAVAQSMNRYFVLNTCNLSENIVSYSTLYGDNAGSYAPIEGLTVTEVIALGDWLGLPYHLVHKTPIDGLQPKTDEEKLGFTYANLDRYIREDIGTPEFKAKIDEIYIKGKFKTDIVRIPHPAFDHLGNFVLWHNELQVAEPKRETSNTAALREALEAIVKVGYPHNFQKESPHIRGYCYEITRAIEKCFAALAEPPRNCDTGKDARVLLEEHA